MRRKILITVLILLVLFAATVGVGWYLLQNESFLKSQLGSNSLKYTGRELTVNGPLKLSLGRVTTLEANDIHFANANWADQPDMVAIGYLKISIELPSLFAGKPVFPDFVLEDCNVVLTKNDTGEANWDMLPDSGPKLEPEPEKPPLKDSPLWMKDIKIKNCELVLAGPALDHPLDIKVSDLAMQHHDDNRWQARGAGSVNDETLSLDGWFAPFSAIFLGGPLEHELKFSLGNTTLESSGSVADAATWTGANLTAQLHGPEMTDILKEFKLPIFSEGTFDFTLRLNTEGDMTKLDLNGDLGSVDIEATGELDRLIKPSKGNVQFSVDGPNLGALAKIFGVDGLVEDAFSHAAHASFSGDAIHFKKATLKTASDHLEIGGHFGTGPGFAGTELDIHFETEEIGRWTEAIGQAEQTVGPLTLDGKLASDSNGLLSIQSKVVHGESTLEVQGVLGHLPDALAPDLKVSLNSPDPSPLAILAGLKNFPAVPLTVQGQFGLKDQQVKLGDVRIDLAGNKAEIDGQVNLKDRYAGSEVDVQLDIKNAGELGLLFGKDGLPDQPVKLTVIMKPDGKGLAFQVNDSGLGKIQLQIDGRIADLEQPLGIAGRFDISLPRLSDISFLLPDMQLPDAPFTARGRADSTGKKVQLQEVTVNLGGNQASIDGYINLVDRYAGSTLNFDLDVKNVGDLGRMFGKDGLPDEPMKLTATVKPAGKGLDFKVSDGDQRDIDLDLEGHIEDLERPQLVDANFSIKLPRLSDIQFLLPDRELPDVPFMASGRLANHQSRTRLDQVRLELGQIKASVDGNLLPDNHFQLSIEATGPDASRLDKLAKTSLPPEPFSLSTSLNGNPSKLEFKATSLSLGKSQVDGDLTIGLGDVTQIKGKIDSPNLDLSHWNTGEEAEEVSKPATKREWMFDDTPVLTLTEHGLDIDLDLQVSKLDLGNTTLVDIALGFVLSHRLLELKSFTFRGTLGGSYNGEFILDGHGSKPKLHFEMSGKDVRLGLAGAPGQDPSTYPPIAHKLTLDGVGATRRELASSLDGQVLTYMGSGQLASAGMDLLFSDFLTQLFDTLNPFAQTSEYTKLDCAVMAADIVSGQVTVFPVIFHTEQVTILSEGTIDLKTEKIDLSFNSKPRTGIGISAGALINPLIKVGGRLTTPAVEMDPAGTVVSGGLAVATLGISVLAKSMSDRFLSSKDPCGEARKEIEKRDSASN